MLLFMFATLTFFFYLILYAMGVFNWRNVQ